MKQASVAIITRTCDRPITLDRTIQDVLNQRYDDWELVLVNNAGSRAQVEQVVERYGEALGNRYRPLHLEKHAAFAAASNHEIANSASKYIVLHDDDDTWHPDFLAETVAYLEDAEPRILAVGTGAALVFERIEGGRIWEIGRRRMRAPPSPISPAALRRRNPFPPICFLYERAAADAIGHYRADLPILSDWDFYVRFSEQFGIGAIPEVLAFWHQRRTPAGTGDGYANSRYKAHLDGMMRLKREWKEWPPLWRYLLWWRY